LLDAKKTNLQVKDDKIKGLYVQDATEVYVSNSDEMMEVMNAGSANRSVASTRMNATSSRSHSIFLVTVSQKNTKTDTSKTGKMYCCDLAGSEKIEKTEATGSTLEEAKMINKSLSALGNVINALTEGKKGGFIPYRDSKLTRIL
jgi:kinesin family protein 5